MTLAMNRKNDNDNFALDGQPEQNIPFDLEQEQQENRSDVAPLQESLGLQEHNLEQLESSPQAEMLGMGKPVHMVTLINEQQTAQKLPFQYAPTLLQSLEAQGADVHYQCREGYCGSCRVKLIEGSVHYVEEPLAWLNDGDILPCCCIPKEAIVIQSD